MSWLKRIGWLEAVGMLVGVTLLAGSLDWRGAEDVTPPQVVSSFRASGPLRAGASKVSLVPDFPAPMAGFVQRGSEPFESVTEPVHARALVLEAGDKRLALVSVELLLVPQALRDKVLASLTDVKLDGLLLAATHTHSSVGGFWDSRLASWLGVGGYDERVEAFLVERIVQSVREAAGRLVPARLSSASMVASHFGLNRHLEKSPVDERMTGVRVTGEDGAAIARVVVLGVHPTIVDRDLLRLSPDWPGAMSSALEADGGVALFWQGAGGDTTWGKRQGAMTAAERVYAFGGAVASDARGVLAAGGEGERELQLSHVRVRLSLPLADASGSMPFYLAPMASNVLQAMGHPGSTEVSFTRLGSLTIAAVPAEPVSALGIEWRGVLGASVVGLADGYIGYVETPERWKACEGEAVRSYFGPELGSRLREALTKARAESERSF